ncbi:hypothetical protein [Nocardia fluminea]|uniref:hypothetical protein n=1 Tax=Nocardia fluminea TaxID=134984 RepID=UPI00343FDD88
MSGQHLLTETPNDYRMHDADISATVDRIRAYLREQAAAWPAPVRGGDEWCSLLEEFGAGSRPADVQTRACWMGGYWAVIGTKLSASAARTARWGLLVARTDPSSVGSRGLSCFVCDMTAARVMVTTVRRGPRADLTEVQLDRVTVPEEYRLGEVGAGWDVMRSLLGGSGGGVAR